MFLRINLIQYLNWSPLCHLCKQYLWKQTQVDCGFDGFQQCFVLFKAQGHLTGCSSELRELCDCTYEAVCAPTHNLLHHPITYSLMPANLSSFHMLQQGMSLSLVRHTYILNLVHICSNSVPCLCYSSRFKPLSVL